MLAKFYLSGVSMVWCLPNFKANRMKKKKLELGLQVIIKIKINYSL